MKLYRLMYLSEAAPALDWNDFKQIMVKSEENNAKLHITGILLLSDNKFLQVLEGEVKALNGLYEKIIQDERHLNSLLLSYTPIHERHFTEWSMRGINAALLPPEQREFLIKKYGKSGDGVAIPEDPYLAHSLLYDVYDMA